MTDTVLAAICGPGWSGGPGWWIAFPIGFWLLFFAAIITWRRRGPWSGGWSGTTAESALAETYARGDITEADYRARLAVLRETRR
jgi:putative membrane protein